MKVELMSKNSVKKIIYESLTFKFTEINNEIKSLKKRIRELEKQNVQNKI